MEEKQCEIHRGHMSDRILRNEKRINNHSERIDALEQYRAGVEQQIKNLVERVDSLITVLRWFIGLIIVPFISFFFYAVQQGIFR